MIPGLKGLNFRNSTNKLIKLNHKNKTIMMCIWCETFINDYFMHYSLLTFSNSYKLLNIVNIAVDIIYIKKN